MPPKFKPVDDSHAQIRTTLRVVGPIVIGVGILFIAAGMVDFFSAMGGFGPPRLFWCFFVGIPLLAIGQGMLRFAYLGSVSRYLSREITPVAVDTFNETARGTRGGVETLARAVGHGVSAAFRGDDGPNLGDASLSCGKCTHPNPADANFCNQCGNPLEDPGCRSCGAMNPPGSQFCNDCGQKIAP